MPEYRQRAIAVHKPDALRLNWFVMGYGEWSGQGKEPRMIDRFETRRHAGRIVSHLNQLYRAEGRLLPEEDLYA